VADWQQYEREITEQLREAYPSARIMHNAKIVGKFSKVERQIDILIEEQASDFAEIARNFVESQRPSTLVDYATATPLATGFLEAALAKEASKNGISR